LRRGDLTRIYVSSLDDEAIRDLRTFLKNGGLDVVKPPDFNLASVSPTIPVGEEG